MRGSTGSRNRERGARPGSPDGGCHMACRSDRQATRRKNMLLPQRTYACSSSKSGQERHSHVGPLLYLVCMLTSRSRTYGHALSEEQHGSHMGQRAFVSAAFTGEEDMRQTRVRGTCAAHERHILRDAVRVYRLAYMPRVSVATNNFCRLADNFVSMCWHRDSTAWWFEIRGRHIRRWSIECPYTFERFVPPPRVAHNAALLAACGEVAPNWSNPGRNLADTVATSRCPGEVWRRSP